MLRDNKKTRTTSMTSFWSFYCSILLYFTSFSSVSIVDFEKLNVSWDLRLEYSEFTLKLL